MGKVLLRDVADVAISNVDKKVLESEIPVKLCNFTDVYYNWSLSSKYSKFLDATATALEIEKFAINNGDVAITKDSETRDDIGISTVFDEITSDLLLGYHCALIRPKKAYLNGAFLNALFHTDFAKKYFSCHASGSGQRYSLSLDSICDFPIELPTLESQLRITNILGSIDKKIEINKKKIARLEAIAQDIYNYWFVQYEFPDETGKPYKSNGGKLVWNEELKRNIPIGWGCGNLYDIADYINGIACQKYRPNTVKTLPVIKIREMHTGIDSETEMVTSSIPSESIIDDEDILFSWSATLEVMYWFGGKAGLNQHIFKVVPKKIQMKDFAFRQIKQYIQKFKKIADSRKTTMGHITTDHINQSRIIIPPNKIVEAYSHIVKFYIKQEAICNFQIRKLTETKQMLLPLLMNGQVAIK